VTQLSKSVATRSVTPRPARRAPTPEALADVALIDGPNCAAAGCMGLTQWHELVKTGNAPQPVIKQPRFTRWRLADVRAWLEQRSSAGTLGGAAR
jgi:predicted DNA-binding transcriptional regulator AlpA